VHKRLQRLKELEEIDFDDVANSGMTKKELLVLRREKEKLERTLGGIRDMARVPSAVWIVDTKKEHLAVDEARKLGIPVVAILDTNCDPDEVDYKIPGNDDAIRSVTLLTRVVADAVADGLMARSRAGGVKPEAGAVAGDEPLAEWERDLLAGQTSQGPAERTAPVAAVPVQNAGVDDAALAGVGIETTADEEIGALEEPIVTDAVTPEGAPAGEALGSDAGTEAAVPEAAGTEAAVPEAAVPEAAVPEAVTPEGVPAGEALGSDAVTEDAGTEAAGTEAAGTEDAGTEDAGTETEADERA
jgi:small subunit ribosomal protein S2